MNAMSNEVRALTADELDLISGAAKKQPEPVIVPKGPRGPTCPPIKWPVPPTTYAD